MMRSVLLTGASGALGRTLLARLRNDTEWHVVATSRRARDGHVPLELADRPGIFAAVAASRPDLILHMAATFVDDLDESYAINVAAARHLLDAVVHCGFRTRVLLVGSAAEYGVVDVDENPIRESRQLQPVSTYGVTKAWQTLLAGQYAARGFDVVVARVFNLDGDGLSPRLFVGRVDRQIEEVRAGVRSVIEVGPLSAIRDYVTLDAAAKQLLAIAGHGRTGGVYHVASGRPVSMRDMLLHRLASRGIDPSIVRASPALSNRSGIDVPVIYADMTQTTQLMADWR